MKIMVPIKLMRRRVLKKVGDSYMVIDKIKQLIAKSQVFKVVLIILIIILMVLYFFAFFTKGANYDDTFLRKEIVNSDNHYIGRNKWGNIHITVKGFEGRDNNFEVIFRLPNNINKAFTVNFTDDDNFRHGVSIKNESDKLLFEGYYRKDSPFLFDKNDNPLFEGTGLIFINDQSPYNSDYNIYFENIVRFAAFENDAIRGDVRYLFVAVLSIFITAIDIKFPLFFFNLRHFMYVEDPKPSELYISIQRISWYVFSIIAFVLLIAAIL